MSQWGQQQGYQYPMQTGMPGSNPQFQQTPQLQQNGQFQQGFGAPTVTGGLLPQRTGFPGTMQAQQTGFPGSMQMQPQQTGFPGSGFLQSQATGYPGMMPQQQQQRAPPPVPPIPSQFQQPSFLSQPPQNRSFLSASPAMGARPLVPQVTGYIDPKLQMMSNTFMPVNTAMPYSATGAPQLPSHLQGGLNLQQSFQQQNHGSAPPRIPWALSKAEKKSYDQIFRAWDAQNTGFISGQNALEVFGQSGLSKTDLARIWTLADVDDRGKLNIAEFHVAMGLIYRKLNGNEIPDTLPQELIPPSARDLGGSVDILKDLLKNETRNRSPSSLDQPVSYAKGRSFNSSNSSLDPGRDATIYKHSDDSSDHVYNSSRRHVDRNAIRGNNDKSGTGDINEMRHMIDNSQYMLDKTSQENASRSAEDEALDAERDDLKYRIKRLTEDLDYVSRGPRTTSKEQDKRRFERELLELRHEKLPELERKLKARDERREREKRQWQRDRDRANERSGKFYDDRDDRYSSSRGYDDRDRPYSRGTYDDERDRYSRRSPSPGRRGDRDYDRDYYSKDKERERERDYDRRSPARNRSPPAPPSAAPASTIRDPPPAPKPAPSPAPATRNMTPAERQAYAQEQARRRIEERKAKLGLVATPSATPVDTSVEDRLEQEKREAEEKVRAAEKEAEEMANTRKERLEREKALKEGNGAPPAPKAAPAPPAPPTPKAAPPPPKKVPPPPKPRTVRSAAPVPPAPAVAPAPPPPAPAPAPAASEVDPEDEALRQRQEEMKKLREARAARMKALEEMEKEEEQARLEEERYQARLRALKERPSASPAPTPPSPAARAVVSPPAPAPPPPPPAAASPPAVSTPDKSSTNPFSRLMGATTSPSTPPTAAGTNPWAQPATTPAAPPPPPVAPVAKIPSIPTPASRATIPTPVSSGPKSYNTAPSVDDEEDWDIVKERDDDDDDSSEDEFTRSRDARKDVANKLFGNLLPRPQSGAGSGPASPAPGASFPNSAAAPTPPPPSMGGPPPPPPPPAAPVAPPPPMLSGGAPSAGPQDRSALLSSIQGGLRLKPAKTVDKSGPQLSGKVLGDAAPPDHIAAAASARPPSPPAMSANTNRQSVDWYAGLAADAGKIPPPAMPTTIDEDAEYEMPEPEPEQHHAVIPDIQVDSVADPTSDLMADIDRSIKLSVRSLYPFEGDGPDDLSFGENLTLIAHPSKTGGDWWYGTLVCTGKTGLFPKTYVQEITPVKAKALYTYTGANPDELSMAEGEEVTVIDQSEEEWWKAEQGGVVFIVPAGYLEVVEDGPPHSASTTTPESGRPLTVSSPTAPPTLSPAMDSPLPLVQELQNEDIGDALDTDSDYHSFEDSDDEADTVDESETKEEREARAHERQMVLEAAGLIVKKDTKPPPRPRKRRPPPAAPQRQSVSSISSKELPTVPDSANNDTDSTRLDDAFDRYEAFRLARSDTGNNRLSAASFDTTVSSPTTSVAMSQAPSRDSETRSYSILNFLGRSKTPVESERRTLTISAPILNNNNASEDPARPTSPAFGSSWASLVDKSALDGIPPNERRRQEAIFELISTENAYVRDLQLIVEIFYSKMLPLLDRKAITVIFANIEDILLSNITFMSSLEERQKECRLYIDRIGDIIQDYMSNMGVYMEYCVNQSNAIKVLQDIRDSNPEVASQLQRIRDGPSARNLDLSSYLLIPMQRITRYPLLIRQISHYTSPGEEKDAIDRSIEVAEKILNHINETIRYQEGQETLKRISKHLWIGQGRLDLTAPTRYMGARHLLKEGILMKAKSGKKLHAFLCSDILVLTDDKVQNLYRMPIALSETQVKDLPNNRDDGFQVALPYPRGGEAIGLRATSVKDCQLWMQAIEEASRKCKDAERRAARKQQRV